MNVVTITHTNGPRVTISGNDDRSLYAVEFINSATMETVYRSTITAGHWAEANLKYYVPWRVTVKQNGEIVRDDTLDLEGRRVLVTFASKALGDTIAWMPYVEEFRRNHQCEVSVDSFHNGLFEGVYPDLQFVDHGQTLSQYHAAYNFGAYHNDYNRNRNNWRLIPLQQVASDALGLPYVEIRPRIVFPDAPRPIAEPYVAISEFSTFLGKQWNYPGGWQVLVDWLNARGLKVISVSKETTALKNVIACNARPIEETLNNIRHAEFFIGVASGLAWAAWAMGIKPVVISGFTKPYSEMTECIRIFNADVCHGCYNDPEFAFDRNNWRWCPRGKDYECTRSISPTDVVKAIRPLVVEDTAIQTRQDERGKKGDWAVFNAVFVNDTYGLEKMKADGFTPGTVLDVGGHIGSFGKKVKALWPEASIRAYEPNYESCELYRRNVPDADVRNEAISHEPGKSCLAEDSNATGGGIMISPSDLNAEGRIALDRIKSAARYSIGRRDVPIVTMEEACADLDGIDLLKLDCEGSEIEILRRMKPETARRIHRIVGEYHYAGGYEEFKKIFASRFPRHAIEPIGSPRPYIGEFTARPSDADKAKRILFIAPHCSTGGCPQYLLKCVEQLKAAGLRVEVIEYRNISDSYTVQKKRIQAMVPMHTLNGDKAQDLTEIIAQFDPHIVHLQEFPEAFMDEASIGAVYRDGRDYRILETSHGLDVLHGSGKRTAPDGYVCVSRYHAEKYGGTVVEYDAAIRRNRILCVGLFAPWKNQAEAFMLARRFPGLRFDFIGNQAPNFREYWQPLMDSKPDNCIVWGECEDVDEFYCNADLVLFPSTEELNPLVPMEALAHGVPILMRDLPAYMGRYHGDPLVTHYETTDEAARELGRLILPMAIGLMEAYG